MLQILYSSGGHFATKMDIKTLLRSELLQNFQNFMVCMDIFLTIFFVVTGVFALFDIFSEKAQHKTYKKNRRFFRQTSLTPMPPPPPFSRHQVS